MFLKKPNWNGSWKKYIQKSGRPKILPLNEATTAFVNGVDRWIDVVTDGGDYPLNDVLPWDDLFDGALRTVIPAASVDDENLTKIVRALKSANWYIPPLDPDEALRRGAAQLFPVTSVKQKKRRLGTGEVYEEEKPVAKLELAKLVIRVIPKGPRAGEETRKTEETSMSRAINKGARGDSLQDWYIPPELADWWQKKQTYYTNPQNAKKIQKLFNEPRSRRGTSTDQVIVLSRHPVDVLRMGDVETVDEVSFGGKIGHCHREGGEYAHCAQQEALGHGPIAYLVNKKDLDYWLSGENPDERMASFVADEEPKHQISDFDNKEIFSDKDRNIKGIKAINRVRLRQYREGETNEMWAVPEKKVYPGSAIVPGFLNAVMDWAWDKQKGAYEEAYEEGEFPALNSFERLGGKYADTRDGELLNLFFSKSGVDPDYRNVWVTHETEEAEELEPTPEELAERMDDRVQEIMDAMNGRMEHTSVYGEVDVYDETPVCLMSAYFLVSFHEDLFGEDGGAEYELPSDWSEIRKLQEEFDSALSENHIYLTSDDMDIDERSNHVTFSFNINNEDNENNADGFDNFADYVESEYDNNYADIRRVMKRVLIREGYMGPDAYENLHKQLKNTEDNEDTLYNHWDFDIDGDEITFMLKDPAELVTDPRFHGLYLGTIPAGTSLTYVFHDWQYEKSAEFDKLFVPQIRRLFDEAEIAALKQLSLPGVEAKEIHRLLLPSRAQFRLKQVYDHYSEPAHIYLQIRMDIEEDISDEQVEEIEYFLKYLDKESRIDTMQKAAEEIFETFKVKAVELKKIEEQLNQLATNIEPIMHELSLLDLMNFGDSIDREKDQPYQGHIAAAVERMLYRLQYLLPAELTGAPQATPTNTAAAAEDEAVRQLASRLNLKKLKEAFSQTLIGARRAAGSEGPGHRSPAFEEFRYGRAGKILGVNLTNSVARQPENTIEGLMGTTEQLIATTIGRIKDAVYVAIKDPADSRTVHNVTMAFSPKNIPEWYKQQLDKAHLSAERILSALPPSALGSRDPAVDELAALVQESQSLINRIDAKLNIK